MPVHPSTNWLLANGSAIPGSGWLQQLDRQRALQQSFMGMPGMYGMYGMYGESVKVSSRVQNHDTDVRKGMMGGGMGAFGGMMYRGGLCQQWRMRRMMRGGVCC